MMNNILKVLCKILWNQSNKKIKKLRNKKTSKKIYSAEKAVIKNSFLETV